MSVALALSAALASVGPDPLSAADLPAVLGKGWWCSWDEVENGCAFIDRYDFRRGVIETCGGTEIAWIQTAIDWGRRDGLPSVQRVLPVLDRLQAQARSMDADRIKFCWTRAFKREGDALCASEWSTEGKPEMRLSRSGAWRDPEDLLIPSADAEAYYRLWADAFADMAAAIPETRRGDPEVKAFLAGVSSDWSCFAFSSRSDGTLVRAISGPSPYESELRPLARPEDGVLIPRG
jgi:hypothetical protein